MKLLSVSGIVFSVVVHLAAWMRPISSGIVVLALVLHVLAMGMMIRLYRAKALPFVDGAKIDWLQKTSSVIHAVMFFATLSFVFHGVMMVLGLSGVEIALLRIASSLWLYVFAVGYGYRTHYVADSRKISRVYGRDSHRRRLRENLPRHNFEQKSPPVQTIRWR